MSIATELTRSLQPTAAVHSVFGGLGEIRCFLASSELGSRAAAAEGGR